MREKKQWLLSAGALVLGLALGLGVSAVAAQDSGSDDEPVAPADGPFAAFRACAEDHDITLPDLAQHRRDREPLSQDERDAIRQAREACADALPRAQVRQCLVDQGVDVPEDGVRDWFRGLPDDERAEVRSAARQCAQDLGLPPRGARCRPHRPGR